MSLIWDRCEALTEAGRTWVGSLDAGTIEVDTSVKSSLDTGSIRGRNQTANYPHWFYISCGLSPTLDFTGPDRPKSVFVKINTSGLPVRAAIVGPSGTEYYIANQELTPNVMTELTLDYSGVPTSELQAVSGFYVIFGDTTIPAGATLWLAGITSEGVAPPPSGIWDRCEALTEAGRTWGGSTDHGTIVVDTSVKSSLGTGSIRARNGSAVSPYEFYVGCALNPTHDFSANRPNSIYVQVDRPILVRVAIAGPDNAERNLALQTVPANTMTEVTLDYSTVPLSQLQAVNEFVVTMASPVAAGSTLWLAGITLPPPRNVQIQSNYGVAGVIVDGTFRGNTPLTVQLEDGQHAITVPLSVNV